MRRIRGKRQVLARRRRGVTAVLAMLYLILFSALAIGFFGSVTTSVQVAKNEQDGARALLAAESGMEFMRYHLAALDMPHDTDPNALLDEVYQRLKAQMEGWPTLGSYTIGRSGNTILVPAEPDGFILVSNTGSRFRATVSPGADNRLMTTVVGSHSGVESARGIEVTFRIAEKASNIFDYGVASRSAIVMGGNTSIIGAGDPTLGSILSTTNASPAVTMMGTAQISGDLSLVSPWAGYSISSNARVAGYGPNHPDFKDHVHVGVNEPSFPTVDTFMFEPYATEIMNDPQPKGEFANIRIKAGTNPTFAANSTLQGVVYVETPNQVTFAGTVTIHGVIVVESDPTGDPSTNKLDFGGSVNYQSVETLGDEFGGLKELTGAAILAPSFHVTFRGTFGTMAGSIIASQIGFTGNAGGTIKGSVVNLDDTGVPLTLSGNNNIIIESQGTSDYPAGVFFGNQYVPVEGSYREVKP